MKTKHARAGFTLIELLVVMAIIAILVGITLGVASGVNRQTAVSQAKAEIGKLQLEIESYKGDRGSFPDELDDLYVWFEEKHGDGNGIYDGDDRLFEAVDMSRHLRPDGTMDPSEMEATDPWGRDYEYDYDSDNPFIYVLGSRGPDGDWNTDDDISTRKGI